MATALVAPTQPEGEALKTKLRGLNAHFRQAALVASAGLLDVNHLAASHSRLVLALSPLVRDYSHASGTLAARQYERDRSLWVPGSYRAFVADPPPKEQIEAVTGWALSPLYGAPKEVEPESEPVEVPNEAESEAVEPVESAGAESADLEDDDGELDDLFDSLQRIILNSARMSTVQNVQRDRMAIGWLRITTAGACDFCLMLASRGLVYKSRAAASFQAHDHCECQAVSRFRNQPANIPPVSQAAAQLWNQTDTSGSNRQAMQKWRAAVKTARQDGTWGKLLNAVETVEDDGDE